MLVNRLQICIKDDSLYVVVYRSIQILTIDMGINIRILRSGSTTQDKRNSRNLGL